MAEQRAFLGVTVDEYIERKVLPQHHDIVAMARALMREGAPEAEELVSYDMITYRLRSHIAAISPTKKDITFILIRGINFEDNYGLLRGVGKHSRHVKLKSVEKSNQKALRGYIKQAVEWDAR